MGPVPPIEEVPMLMFRCAIVFAASATLGWTAGIVALF
jgi:hypothetical protein